MKGFLTFWLIIILVDSSLSGKKLQAVDAHEFCDVTHPSVQEAGLDLARMHRLQMNHHHHERHHHHHSKHNLLRQLQPTSTCEDLCKQCIEIDTKFHLMVLSNSTGGYAMPHPTETMLRLPEDDTLTLENFTSVEEYLPLVEEQMIVLNQAYADTPFRFKYIGWDRSNLLDWLLWPMDHRREMTDLIGQKDPTKLDVFVSFQVESQYAQLRDRFGFADFPSHQYTSGDGIYVRADVLPGAGGGAFGLWHEGYTVVHEVGHWLGLYHPFENWGVFEPCSAGNWGDMIDDTPTMAAKTADAMPDCKAWSQNTSVVVDTCPDLPGADPVYNFMNILDDDSCFVDSGEFTCDQIERMYFQWLLYRDFVSACDTGEMEVEFIFQFDKMNHFQEDGLPGTYIELVEDTIPPVTIFDSRFDHEPGQVSDLQDTLFVDLCVDATKSYLFSAFDAAGNGFAEGAYAEIFLNGESLGKIEGNFGSEASIAF